MKKKEIQSDIGIIGLGTMGRNLLLNISDHDFAVSGYDRDPSQVELLSAVAGDRKILATSARTEFLRSLKKPRRIILLVPAGKIVDQVISSITPDLEKNDLIIDAGNSFYKDTEIRKEKLSGRGIRYMGTGVSGGEEGARKGPSIMPGGDQEDWESIKPVFEAIAARVSGKPCVAYMGSGAAGHFVKMVHNGIEYAIMQLISESYDLLKRVAGMNNAAISDAFREWNTGRLNSFLVEITAEILLRKDDDGKSFLVDNILDVAGQKGTGIWTVESAMELQIPVPTIDMAVNIRDLSKYKDFRKKISSLNGSHRNGTHIKQEIVEKAGNALFCGMLISYAQGFALLNAASEAYGFGTDLRTVASIWRGGCIIRSSVLNEIMKMLNDKGKKLLLLNPGFYKMLSETSDSLRKIIHEGVSAGIPVSGFMSALGYLDAFRSENLPVNLIQAQRDFFGSHTYERTDREGIFHTQWD